MGKEGTKEKLDIELEAPADFTSPEVLYQDLVKTIHKYHPSDDISMSERFKELVLKTSDAAMRRGFESHSLRQILSLHSTWSDTQEAEGAPLLRE